MKGLFIPEITSEMFRNGCLESIEALMAEGEIYDIDYQQPCEDCISRTRLLARIDEERKHLLDIKMDGAEHIIVHHARRIIEDMPPVTPKARWIPCSERLPEQEGWYLISLGDKTYGGADVDMYCKGWVKYGTHVLAWMPLPQAYKAESEDKE